MKTKVASGVFGCAALIGLAVGCGEGPPGGGLTNGPAPATSDEKAGMRSDLPTPAPPDRGEVLGELGDRSTNAGTGGRGEDGASVKAPEPTGAAPSPSPTPTGDAPPKKP
jgi:hypothetical protein